MVWQSLVVGIVEGHWDGKNCRHACCSVKNGPDKRHDVAISDL